MNDRRVLETWEHTEGLGESVGGLTRLQLAGILRFAFALACDPDLSDQALLHSKAGQVLEEKLGSLV